MASDRWLGLFFVGFAVLLYAVIVPWQADDLGYGFLRPRTLPRVLAVAIGVCGLLLILRPPGDARPLALPWGRAALFAGVLAAGLLAMTYLGFGWVAPPLALAIMLLAHERRPLWLLFGAAGMPALIWLAVAVGLDRPLP